MHERAGDDRTPAPTPNPADLALRASVLLGFNSTGVSLPAFFWSHVSDYTAAVRRLAALAPLDVAASTRAVGLQAKRMTSSWGSMLSKLKPGAHLYPYELRSLGPFIAVPQWDFKVTDMR